jgi:hypothetical protein
LNNQHGSKCDVWSFGCLLWEVATLGGTPYWEVRRQEVGPRVLRGLRLGQTQGVSDSLYQVLYCEHFTALYCTVNTSLLCTVL